MAHACVRRAVLCHQGTRYLACGISEVVTHPVFRRWGYASELLCCALRFMVDRKADLCIFTCEKDRTSLYTGNGWTEAPSGVLVGGARKNPFRSDRLGLVTLVRFLSEKSRQCCERFSHRDIYMELGEITLADRLCVWQG